MHVFVSLPVFFCLALYLSICESAYMYMSECEKENSEAHIEFAISLQFYIQ